MNFIRNNTANALTLANLFSGCVGAVHLIDGAYQVTAVCLVLSLIFDFFDGFVARALNANSELGVQLDSLADMVSFGVVPGLAMYYMLTPFGNHLFGVELPFGVRYLGLFITLFSCLRLAIFNIDIEQKYCFKGLNTPSNTVLIFGLLYAFKENNAFSFLMNNEVLLVLLTLVSSWLLVSPIKMIAMKLKTKTLKDNYSKVFLLLGGVLILIFFGVVGIPLLVIYYIIISLIFHKELN